ncbi:glutamate synthase [Nesterenkonia sphaerica]|uniref:Glutamate synthase n=1 Tax=Nesterenkonia sphaerica TaxID=1804988 RepID=A0A5R9AB89_9MICC|nr:glutamate synthase [Nesterenkonia sphaerica]TLP75780.1 glutamate synthase [Nesterenkonia sphaerica]
MESLNDGTAEFDLAVRSVRELNAELHAPSVERYVVRHPRGAHAVAAGVNRPLQVRIDGDVGYYCAGMNQEGLITVDGSAGPGVAENMMSGVVRIRGNASQSAGATAHGGLLIIEGNASTRCGISLKGGDIVVGGEMGAMGAFMAQAGRIVVCGDAGDGLGDSIYEAQIYIRGSVGTLGADCVEKEMRAADRKSLQDLLVQAGMTSQAEDASYLDGFRRYGSARTLYHFTHDHAGSY